MFPSTDASLIACQRRTLAPPFNSGVNAASVSVQCHYSAGTDVGHGSLETTGNGLLDIKSHNGINGVTFSYCYSGDYPIGG